MYNPLEIEKEIAKFWSDNSIYIKNKKKNQGKKPFYFLQGPPYTSGRIHIGTAWNNSIKDFILRYKRMKGFNVWDRAGYDMHGIPIESRVQNNLDLKTKEDIEKFGVASFIKECLKFSKENLEIMNKELLNLGVWMDYENAYMTIDEKWIESVWFLVKKADEQKRLYKGERTMTWCAHCETTVSKHECEYKKVIDKSIFVKFKVRNEKKYLIIWTTTPWTIAFNLAIMVNPDSDYVEAEVEGETWIIAKELADSVIKQTLKKDYVIKEEFKGERLKGLRYEHPWEKEISEYTKLKANNPNIHTIILSNEYVNLESGTGLVHCAPGCGPEDYEVGHRNNIKPFNNLNEKGIFPNNMGSFSKLKARIDDEKFIQKLDEDNVLIGTLNYEHDYPHHNRCNTPVIFKTTKQWFFKVEDLKERMLQLNKEVNWIPNTMKNSFNAWLDNLRDNSITRQRYWGTPAPIWSCDKCKKYVVISTKEELVKLSGEEPENLHRPWIDLITFRCECGGIKRRIQDILDVWIDAGVASYASLFYPHKKEYFEHLFPANFILEGTDQIRGWFNLLMVSSIIAFDKIPFENVYVHGMITDVKGEKMSKSLGNIISPKEVTDKHGIDTLRLYLSQTNPGVDINFSWEEAKNKYKTLSILWNIQQYLLDYSRMLNIDPTKLSNELEIEEKYILSKLNKTIRDVTELYEFYNLDQVPSILENFILSLSREYIQATRDKINEKPQLVLSTVFYSMKEIIKMLSTVCPFISEKIYQNLKLPFNLEQESVTLENWPEYDPSLLDENLEKQFLIFQDILQAGLAAREKVKKGVRWPLKELNIISSDEDVKTTLDSFKNLLKIKLNVKEVSSQSNFNYEEINLSPNKNKIGREFKQNAPTILKQLDKNLLQSLYTNGKISLGEFTLTKEHVIIEEVMPKHLTFSEFKLGKIILDITPSEELELEGHSRELIRRIQDLRKEKGLKKKDKINLSIFSDYSLEKFKEFIKEKVGASVIEFTDKNYDTKEEFEIKDKKFKISFNY